MSQIATRTERVVLELESNLTTGLARDAAAVALLKRELAGLDGSNRKASTSTRTLERDTESFARRADRSSSSIDQFSGRLGLLIDAATALGPALVPLGAVGIAGVEGLAASFGFAAAGAGTMVLALHGVSDALTKFNKASLDPTAANIKAAQLAMDKLPPSAQQFVLQLHRLGPELKDLQTAAGEDFFPGLTDGLDAVMRDSPLVQHALRGIGGELGNLAREAGRSLSSDQWRPFLRFVGDEAPGALDQMGHAAGLTAHGVAAIWMAFQPLNDQMGQGLVELAGDFDRWATSLDKTKGFEDFLDYVRENSPRVIQLLGDVGDLFVNVAQAAAPLGGPTIQALDLIVKALDLIANSPLGTPLLLLLQLNSVLRLTSRGLGALGFDAKIGLGGVTAGAREGSTALKGLRADAASAGAALRGIGTNIGKNAAGGTPLLTGVNREGLANLAKGAALAGGMAFAVSGLDQKMGLTNATSLAMAGSLAGPWGSAVGGAVGLALDWQAALQKDKEEVSGLRSEVSQFAASGNIVALGKLAQTAQTTADSVSGLGAGLGEQIASKASIPVAAFDTLSGAINKFNGELTGSTLSISNLTQLQQIATRMQPAMEKLGLTFDDLVNLPPDQLPKVINHLVQITRRSDAAVGSTRNVAHAFASMGDDALTADQRVQGLTDSLDALLDPKLNLGQAADAFQRGLNDLKQSLDKTGRSLKGNSDAAITNRDAIRQQVTNLKAWVEAQAKAGVAPEKMIATLKEGRKALLDTGEAAGLNRDEIRRMLDEMKLTPKLIKTAISLTGVDAADRELSRLTRTRIVHIDVQTRFGHSSVTATGGHVLDGFAGGGTIPGPRAPYGDRVLTMLAPGEEVISNRFGQADQHRELLKAINARRYADGGTVAQSRVSVNVAGATTVRGGGDIDYNRLASAMAALRPAPPVYGNIYMQPHNYNEFRRELDRDRAMASLSGVRRD